MFRMGPSLLGGKMKDVDETQDISKAKAALEIVSITDPSIPDYQI